jgi:hypothetical protein
MPMRSTPLRRTPFTRRTTTLTRSTMTPTLPPRRDWKDARAKVDAEGRCRSCRKPAGGGGSGVVLEAAHVIGREHDQPKREGVVLIVGVLWVDPVDVVPLCRTCHALYDQRRLDLLPVLTIEEQTAAVAKLGLIGALRRIALGGVDTGGRVP